MSRNGKIEETVTIEDLYPELSPEQQREADAVFGEYLELMIHIFNRIRSDPEAYARFEALTDLEIRSTIR